MPYQTGFAMTPRCLSRTPALKTPNQDFTAPWLIIFQENCSTKISNTLRINDYEVLQPCSQHLAVETMSWVYHQNYWRSTTSELSKIPSGWSTQGTSLFINQVLTKPKWIKLKMFEIIKIIMMYANAWTYYSITILNPPLKIWGSPVFTNRHIGLGAVMRLK